MSSMSSVAGLSKYITTLPNIKVTVLLMSAISFIMGVIYFLIQPFSELGLIGSALLGGFYGFIVFGVSSIMSGAIDQQVINLLHGINVKLKHSMFLSGLSMTILLIILVTGGAISAIFHLDLTLNSLLFGCVIVYGFNTLVFWATAKISFSKAALVSGVSPPGL